MYQKYMKGVSKGQLNDKIAEMFPGDKLAPYRPDPKLKDLDVRVLIALEQLAARSKEDLWVSVKTEKWGGAMQQVHNLRQIFTLEWQMKQRNNGQRRR